VPAHQTDFIEGFTSFITREWFKKLLAHNFFSLGNTHKLSQQWMAIDSIAIAVSVSSDV